MEKLDKIQKLHRLLQNRRYPIAISRIAEELDHCTNDTAKTIVDILRYQLLAPLEYDQSSKGWYYNKKNIDTFELPGLWLTADELHGFAAILNVLNTMDKGFLGDEIAVVHRQVEKLLKAKGVDIGHFKRVIKYLSTNKQPVTSQYFATITDALIHQKQLLIHYTDYSNKQTQRTISPQTLIHYQENWYLDAWCHKREALRSFMLPRITKIIKTKTTSKKIPQTQLKEHYQSSYGIFAGKPKHTAILLFYPHVAREAANIQWHPEQAMEWQDHKLQVTIPYNDDRELIRDILKYGNNIEVIKPAALKNKIKRIAQSMVGMYS